MALTPTLPPLLAPTRTSAPAPAGASARRVPASQPATHATLTAYTGSRAHQRVRVPLPWSGTLVHIASDDAVWTAALHATPCAHEPTGMDLRATFRATADCTTDHSVALTFAFDAWSRELYVFMPAAVYNGNRFAARILGYPPSLDNPADIGADMPPIITDVPRLNCDAGPSRLALLTRDMATPAVGVFDPHTQRAWLFFTPPATALGDTGIDLVEDEQRTAATLSFVAPGVREEYRYRIVTTQHPSSDRGVCFRAHDQVDIVVRLFSFACPDLATLFAEFMRLRTTLTPAPDAPCLLPFSAAWQILEEKHNRENWCAEYGFYATVTNAAQLQPGWVGGLMATHPLLLRGTALSRERVARTFDFISDHGCAPSGFLKAIFDHGHWRDDGFRPPLSDHWLMTRKSADVLYFMLKQFMLMDQQGCAIKPAWRAAARACADAFVRTWQRDGQFGQFVHADTGAIIVGGSAAAGMAPAGLALAACFFNDQAYLQTALASAQYFNHAFVQRGYTLGGPGEICQCPDSESAFGILEAFVVLLEVTGERRWRDAAEAMAGQCASWCMSYDYQFPPASTFGRMHMRTTGTVFASVQNKHSAPGICTLSGDALFKLFRATGRREYLALARDIAHALPQYLSRTDRPIHAPQGTMPDGWICERVNTSDWCEPIGEIFHGSCWCEVSLMLTIVELPGVYVQPDTGLVCAFDHVNARLAPAATIAPAVIIDNPTGFDAEVTLLVETATDAARRPLGQNGLCNCRRVHVPAGGAATVALRA